MVRFSFGKATQFRSFLWERVGVSWKCWFRVSKDELTAKRSVPRVVVLAATV